MMKPGDRYNRLEAIKFMGRDSRSNARWSFRCDCGSIKIAFASNVEHGSTMSCGCLLKESARKIGKLAKTHGMSRTKIYRVWAAMIRRCENPHDPKYESYGGRGIYVCDRWKKFEHFYTDMGPRPSPGYSLDRIDNNGPYDPNNCRWATAKEQQRNTRSNVFVEVDGQNVCLSEAAQKSGINITTFRRRIGLHQRVMDRLR